MNHHPPSPVGRVLTVVLGALPFIVITLLVFKHWPPLEDWDRSVAARAAAYGFAHEGLVDFTGRVGKVCAHAGVPPARSAHSAANRPAMIPWFISGLPGGHRPPRTGPGDR